MRAGSVLNPFVVRLVHDRHPLEGVDHLAEVDLPKVAVAELALAQVLVPQPPRPERRAGDDAHQLAAFEPARELGREDLARHLLNGGEVDVARAGVFAGRRGATRTLKGSKANELSTFSARRKTT